MSPASTLLEVPSDSAFRNHGGRADNMAHVVSAWFWWLRLNFHVYSIKVRHIQHLSPSLFLITIFPQHSSPPELTAFPALQGVTLYGHLHPPILQHDTSLSCNFYFSRQFHWAHRGFAQATSICSNTEHPGKIPTQLNVLKENTSVLTKICIKIKALKQRKTMRMIWAVLPARKEGSF